MDKTKHTYFSSLISLYGVDKFEVLRSSHVMIIGIGGVGSWSAEALARSAVGEITLVDLDEVCSSNINRQIHALTTTVGQSKVDVMANRIRQINPECKVHTINDFFTEKSCELILSGLPKIDFIIDAIDSLKNKCLLIAEAHKRQIPLVTVGGAGGKKDPTLIQIKDLARSYDDALLFRVRKKLRNDYGFTRSPKRKFKIDCIFSPENTSSKDICSTSEKKNCDNGLGTAAFVTASFGLHAASHVINKLTINETH